MAAAEALGQQVSETLGLLTQGQLGPLWEPGVEGGC